ncbi:MAG: HlyD family efflux transporter periplasmic adaptor subunit [Flavobacteriales bacterium]
MDRPIDPRPARKRRTLVLAAGGVVLLVLVAVWMSAFTTKRTRVEAARVTIGTVERKVFKEFVPVTASVLPIKTVFLDAVQGGTVEEVMAEDGHDVAAGTPILRLMNQQFQMDAINREAQLLDQQNNLRNTRLNMDQQTNNWKQQLMQLDYDLVQVERTWKVNEGLLRKGLVAQQEHDRSREAFEVAQQRRRLLVANIRNDSLFRRTQEGQINASLELITDNLAFLHRALDNLTVRAPMDGQLSGLRAEVGQTIAAGARIAQIDIMTGLKLRAKVPEHYVGRVAPGLNATFAFAGKDYAVTVSKVFPEVNNGEFEADLLFAAGKPDAIKRGQSLQVRLQLGEETQAVLVPRGPFFQDTGGQWIYVLRDGRAVKRIITLGRQNPDHYEVLSGLEPGEQVITSRYDLFNNADEVIVQ